MFFLISRVPVGPELYCFNKGWSFVVKLTVKVWHLLVWRNQTENTDFNFRLLIGLITSDY